jgi:hypothetical protein
MSTNELKRLDDELNEMIRRGQILAAIERYYAVDAEMQENQDPPTRGRAANLVREEAFWKGVELHEARLVAHGVGDDVSFGEWTFDWTIGGARSQLTEVAVRRWKDGRVVAERFYYKA